MIFKCKKGPATVIAKLMAEKKAMEKEIERLRKWHSYFAWKPVVIDAERCAWLQKVERRFPRAEQKYQYIQVYDIRYGEPEYRLSR